VEIGMTALGNLAFLAPAWLFALLALPVLWWLLRVTPPAPRRIAFPPIRLLLELIPREETPARTPWWLLLLRLVIAAAIILALAEPLLNPQTRLPGSGPVIIVVDDGWAAGRGWDQRKKSMQAILDRAERAGRSTMLLATATTLTGEPPRVTRLGRANDTRTIAGALQPKPWPVDRAAARRALAEITVDASATIVYLADGIDDPGFAPLVERMQQLGAVEVIRDAAATAPRLMTSPSVDPLGWTIAARRLVSDLPETITVRAAGDDGRTIAREPLNFAAGEAQGRVRLTMPVEIRNRIVRVEIENEQSSGGIVLIDERYRHRPVGIVTVGAAERTQPLLSETYYIERALQPLANLRSGTIDALLKRELAVLVLADVGRLSEPEFAALEPWVQRGGLLLRFAGPRLAEEADDLVPVPLRRGGSRAFGGAMTWAQPSGLAPFESQSPLAGLAVPADVRVMRQVLAEPSLDLSAKTWARLVDGTPIVTADRRGKGWVVLVHTTANPDWSSLAISGLFVEILERVVQLSQGVGAEGGTAMLSPLATLDGFGRVDTPPPSASGLSGDAIATTPASAKHPPGWYGSDSARRAVNLSANLAHFAPIAVLPSGVASGVFYIDDEVDIRPWLYVAALLLLLLDLLLSLWLRGLKPRFGAPRAAAILLALAIAADATQASAQTRRDDDAALIATLTTHLAHVRTGVAEVDELARAGLASLSTALQRRTAVDAGAPIGVDVESDELAFFPLLYWPVALEAPRPSPAAMARLQAYLRNGGMILFDTRTLEFGAPGTTGPAALRLREVLRGLDLPRLVPVPKDHVLTKSFYLLQEFPGRWIGAPVWVEAEERGGHDGISSVVIGAHDWAAAWASDNRGRALYAAVPGGDQQREHAIRFGVNLVMYALTGNYKADQVHVDAILERLRR
jgi:hypothetical protein